MGLKRKLMNMMMPKEFGFISGLFHAGIFTLQSNIFDTLGKVGYSDFIFPAIKESISKSENIGIEAITGEDIEEFGNRFIKVLKKSLLVDTATLTKKSDDLYVFSLKKCFMAKAAHQIAGTKGVCPMAMVMGAMIEKYTQKDVAIEYSNLTLHGSITEISVT